MEDNKQPQFMVAIKCMTYNHKPYILDALNGFVMQKTTLPFIIILVDDASTDGEPEVIQKFISEQFDISDKAIAFTREDEHAFYTYARHLSNKQCYIIYLQLKRNLYRQGDKKKQLYERWCSDAKYIAICEGDDYWTNSLKLQMQVDFMEEHNDYAICFHGAKVLKEYDRDAQLFSEDLETKEYTIKEVFPKWITPTASFLYRNGCYTPENWKRRDLQFGGDRPLLFECMKHGRLWCFSDLMSVYRVHQGSIMDLATLKDDEDPNYGYVNQLKFLYINFPALDKTSIIDTICWYNFDQFNKTTNFIKKLSYVLDAAKYSKKECFLFFKRKVKSIIKQVL